MVHAGVVLCSGMGGALHGNGVGKLFIWKFRNYRGVLGLYLGSSGWYVYRDRQGVLLGRVECESNVTSRTSSRS